MLHNITMNPIQIDLSASKLATIYNTTVDRSFIRFEINISSRIWASYRSFRPETLILPIRPRN